MQFLKTLFWVILAVIIVIFALRNWVPVSVLIWSDIRVDTKLPVLVIGAFLLGFLPPWLLHRATRWRLNRRVRSLEAASQSSYSAAPTPPASSAPLDLKPDQITPVAENSL